VTTTTPTASHSEDHDKRREWTEQQSHRHEIAETFKTYYYNCSLTVVRKNEKWTHIVYFLQVREIRVLAASSEIWKTEKTFFHQFQLTRIPHQHFCRLRPNAVFPIITRASFLPTTRPLPQKVCTTNNAVFWIIVEVEFPLQMSRQTREMGPKEFAAPPVPFTLFFVESTSSEVNKRSAVK